MEKERQNMEVNLQKYIKSDRQKEKQLFEQQLRLQTFEDELMEKQPYLQIRKGKDKLLLFMFSVLVNPV